MRTTFSIILTYALPILLYGQSMDTLTVSKDTVLLEEVQVSTGLQRIPKERATGSFDYISQERFNQQVTTDVLSRLEATASGYLFERPPSGSPRPLVRGLGTLLGPSAPLIILDNFPYEGDIDDLNPHDVADITILKDAAAASIWGARAANGVIVIQTKKGSYRQPMQVTLNTNLTIGAKPDLYYVRQMASPDFVDIERMLYENGQYESQINSSSFPALTPVVEFLRQLDRTDDQAQINAIERQIEQLKTHDVRDDFNRYFYRYAYNQQHALNLRGGGDRSAWAAMAGFDRNVGNLDDQYNRINLKLQQQYRPIAALELHASVSYTQTSNKSGKPDYPNGLPGNELYPYAAFTNEAGDPAPLYLKYSQSFVNGITAEGNLLRWDMYPLSDYRESNSMQQRHGVLLDAGAAYTLPLGLKLALQYQYHVTKGQSQNFSGSESFVARDLVNLYTAIGSDGEVIRPIPVGGIMDLSSNGMQAHQGRSQLTYERKWHAHQIATLLGAEVRHASSTRQQHRLYGYDPHTLNFSNVDLRNPYPLYISGRNAFIPPNLALDDRTTRFVSLFANGAYSYTGKYTLSFSARRDASNLFGLHTNDQWNLFWSAGGAWHVSQESFYHSSWLHYLKLRATYGLSGNIDPAMVAVTTLQYMGANQYTNTPYTQFSNHYNPDLRWETVRMFNVGVDFRTKHERLVGSVELYTKKGIDLFGQALVDQTTGVGNTITKNISSMRGFGWDVQLTSNNLTGTLHWQTHLNLSHYRTEIVKNDPPSTSASSFLSGLGGAGGNFSIKGKPINALYAYRWAGLDAQTGDPQGYLDGAISKDYDQIAGFSMQVDDLRYVGPTAPQTFGSLNNLFSYRNFSAQFSLLFKFGHFFRRSSINYGALFRNRASDAHADISNRWRKPGDEQHTDVPSMVYPAISRRDQFYTGSEALVERGDHIRFQFLRLGYDFRNIQIYLQATNLGLIWKANKAGLDPEVLGRYAMPAPPQYAIGIKVQFSK